MKTLEGGLEPPTLWLTATRSNQLSYSSFADIVSHFNLMRIMRTNSSTKRKQQALPVRHYSFTLFKFERQVCQDDTSQ